MVILCPNFFSSFLEIYSPIPVELAPFLPLEPVNVLSKTRFIALVGIPIPLSYIDNIVLSSSSLLPISI